MKVFELRIPPDFIGGHTNFNPSIARLGDGRYLMSCHTFRRYAVGSGMSNHPWDGGPGSSLWWGLSSNGLHGSLIFEVFFDGVRLEVIQVLKLVNNVVSTGVDRIQRGWPDSTGLAGFNGWGTCMYKIHVNRRTS